MGLFSKRTPQPPAGPPSERHISRLNPAFFAEIHRSIQGFGGTDSLADVAYGVANAIDNTAQGFFVGPDADAGQRFNQEFSGRSQDDLDAADRMIDWLIRWDPITQDTLVTLLRRLNEVLSKPPNP